MAVTEVMESSSTDPMDCFCCGDGLSPLLIPCELCLGGGLWCWCGADVACVCGHILAPGHMGRCRLPILFSAPVADLEFRKACSTLGSCFHRIAADPTPATTAYIVVRRDLPLGHIAAQVAHAAGSAGRHPPGTYVVVLAARDEGSLKEIAARLDAQAVPFERVEESDGAFAGQLMAIGLHLVTDRTKVRKVLSSLPLLR